MTRCLRKPKCFWLPVFLLVALLVAACSTTQIKAAWKDPAYLEHPNRIMVVSVARSPLKRRIFEDEFVRQLRERGTDAIASYAFVPDSKGEDQARIAKAVKEQGADAVLITRLVSKKTVKVLVPGTVYYPPRHYGKWRDYYSQGYQAVYMPGYVAEDEYALMETNLYDARNDNLVWAATSETEVSGADQNRLRSYIGIMVNTMMEQNVLNRKARGSLQARLPGSPCYYCHHEKTTRYPATFPVRGRADTRRTGASREYLEQRAGAP